MKTITLRTTGFASSLLLTLLAYFIIISPASFSLTPTYALITILCLALLQFTVQFIFFLDLWRQEGAVSNLFIFVSTLSVLFIIVFFSIWIMHNLDTRMMPPMH